MNELTVMKILKVKVDISQADKEPMLYSQGKKKMCVGTPQSTVVISRKHKYLNEKVVPLPLSRENLGQQKGCKKNDCTVWQEVAFDADRLCLCVCLTLPEQIILLQ